MDKDGDVRWARDRDRDGDEDGGWIELRHGVVRGWGFVMWSTREYLMGCEQAGPGRRLAGVRQTNREGCHLGELDARRPTAR